jgi:hypothetical protein
MTVLLATLAILVRPTGASAQDVEPAHFDRPLAVGAYATGWEGAYLGGGLGGRIRWEPFDWLGIEGFAEHLLVENPGGVRHDHPIGFNAFVPWRVAAGLRLRPLFGFCAVFSLIEPDREGGPRADDIVFGVHAGGGIEWAPWDDWSFFLDAQAVAYLGHDRRAQGWTGSVDEELRTTAVVQLAAGLQLHFGG